MYKPHDNGLLNNNSYNNKKSIFTLTKSLERRFYSSNAKDFRNLAFRNLLFFALKSAIFGFTIRYILWLFGLSIDLSLLLYVGMLSTTVVSHVSFKYIMPIMQPIVTKYIIPIIEPYLPSIFNKNLMTMDSSRNQVSPENKSSIKPKNLNLNMHFSGNALDDRSVIKYNAELVGKRDANSVGKLDSKWLSKSKLNSLAKPVDDALARCYGNPLPKPNADALAKTNVRFDINKEYSSLEKKDRAAGFNMDCTVRKIKDIEYFAKCTSNTVSKGAILSIGNSGSYIVRSSAEGIYGIVVDNMTVAGYELFARG